MLASGLLWFKGSGEGSIFSEVLSGTIEQTAAFSITEPSQNQLFDMNALEIRGHDAAIDSDHMETVQESSVLSYQSVLTTMFEEDERTGKSTYIVQDGDVVSSIAADYGLSVQTLISANNLKNADAIKPGTELVIPPIDGITYIVKKGDSVSSVAKRYRAEEARIITFNDLPLSGELQAGDEIIIPGGVMIADDGNAKSKVISSSKRFAGLPKFEGYFITPASGVITQLAHVRNGYDLANKTGTPIYAAASGQVNFAANSGYNNGYGREVRISHANGTETLYGHFSKVVVVTGETVEQGQLIGYMGSTGHSTGPHLHFEIHGGWNILARYGLHGTVIAKQK